MIFILIKAINLNVGCININNNKIAQLLAKENFSAHDELKEDNKITDYKLKFSKSFRRDL